MTDNNKIDVISLFTEAAFEVSGRKLEKLELETQLADLALDSVVVMEIVGYVEQKLDVRFNDEDLAHLATLKDLQTLIEKTKRAA
jgi:acyl carrier protein